MFTKDEIKLMKKYGLNFNFKNPTLDDLDDVDDIITTVLMRDGFDEEYNVNKIGKICENIIDKLPE